MTLASYLAQSGTSHADFAKLIGVSQAAITRYARGDRIPRPAQMQKIAEVTRGKVTANDFMVRTEGAAA